MIFEIFLKYGLLTVGKNRLYNCIQYRNSEKIFLGFQKVKAKIQSLKCAVWITKKEADLHGEKGVKDKRDANFG